MPQQPQQQQQRSRLQNQQRRLPGASGTMTANQFLQSELSAASHSNPGFIADDIDDSESDDAAGAGGGSSAHRCSHAHSHSHGPSGNPQLPTQQQVSPMSVAYQLLPLAPCLLLIVLKLLQSHSTGLMMFCGLYVTYFYANSHLVALATATRREARTIVNRLGAAWLAVAMAASVGGVLYYYRGISLWRCLCCMPPLMPAGAPLDLWTLAFVLTSTDLLLKLGLIGVKALVVMATTAPGVSRLGRCRIFVALERLYHLYRMLPPVLPWLNVLTDGFAESRVYCTVLVVLYTLVKLWHSWRVTSVSLSPLRLALFSHDLGVIGGRVSLQHQQAAAVADDCPLCHESPMERPVRLACCTHVFCEDCVMRWLSCAGTARVCPLCRVGFATLPAMAAAAADSEADPLKYMNGGTCFGLQLY